MNKLKTVLKISILLALINFVGNTSPQDPQAASHILTALTLGATLWTLTVLLNVKDDKRLVLSKFRRGKK